MGLVIIHISIMIIYNYGDLIYITTMTLYLYGTEHLFLHLEIPWANIWHYSA